MVLAWLVAGQIEPSRHYLMVAAALLLFLLGSTALGLLLGAVAAARSGTHPATGTAHP